VSQKESNHQSKIQPDSQISPQASKKDERSSIVEELRMQLERERKEKEAKEQALMVERQRVEAERKEKEAERQRAEKAEKRLKRIFKRGLRFEDLGLKEAFFGFLKNLKIKTIQTTISKFQTSRTWFKNNLSQGNPLAYLILIILISLFVIPSSFLISQLGKTISQQQGQQTQQQTQQHFSTGELNLADQRINPSATLATSSAHAHAHQTKEDFEGSEMNIAKGFGYTTTATNLLQPLGTAPNISDTALYRSPRFDLGAKTKPTEMIISKTAPSSGTDFKVYARSGNLLALDTDNISENILRDTSKEDFEAGLIKTDIEIIDLGQITSASLADPWTQATAAAAWTRRNYHTSLVYDNKMWVIGGWDGAYKNDVWSSTDGIVWTQATAAAAWTRRNYHTSLVYDNKMWVIGGYRGLSDVWYSADGITWTQSIAAAAWPARFWHTSLVYNNQDLRILNF